jgi:hypothetical protein
MVSLTLATTGSAKRKVVRTAFEGCGITEWTPEEEESAVVALGDMMQEWPFSVLGYVEGNGTAEELTGFDRRWDQVAGLSLAQRLSPTALNGQSLSQESRTMLTRSRTQLESYAGTLSMPTATMVSAISGEGNRRSLGSPPFIHET